MDSNRQVGESRGIEVLVRVEQVVSAALVVLILGLVTLQVVGRFLLDSPYAWTEELSRFGLIWLTFIGAAFVMARGRHIAVDVVSQPLGARGRMTLDIASSLITIIASGVVLPASFGFTVSMNRVGSPSADIPMSFVYAASLVGFTLLALHSLFRLISAVRRGPSGYVNEDIGEHIVGGGSS